MQVVGAAGALQLAGLGELVGDGDDVGRLAVRVEREDRLEDRARASGCRSRCRAAISMTSATASFDSSMPPSALCSASRSWGGVRSCSRGPPMRSSEMSAIDIGKSFGRASGVLGRFGRFGGRAERSGGRMPRHPCRLLPAAHPPPTSDLGIEAPRWAAPHARYGGICAATWPVDNSVECLRETPPSLCTTPVDNVVLRIGFDRIIRPLTRDFLLHSGVDGNVPSSHIEGFADHTDLCTNPWKAQLRRCFLR